MSRIYTNFDEIEKDLKLLKLQKDIAAEEIKLSIHNTKGSFSFMSTAGSMISSILQKVLVAKIVSKLFGYKKVKEVDED
ncbi:DUF6327 family protein [Croceiramulus getboli]|nr:DUF6327 family protein [Flavobacteriaceae bacterium YJPT1-3]